MNEWRSDAGLQGRVVIVTGAGGGIGTEVARGFAEAGSLVAAVDRPGSPVAEVVRGLPGHGHQAIEDDLADLASHDRILDRVSGMGSLTALAHLAAVLRRRATVNDVTEEDWDIQHGVNLKATFFLNRSVRNYLVEQGTPGAIVNFSSQGWWTGGFGGSVVYAAAKGGVVSMSRGLARSFAPDLVRVNVVSPGGVDTQMMTGGVDPAANEAFIKMIPLGRFARPDELVGAVIFLASDASSYITGAVINVSGGQLMY
ncbi:MAG: SDR family oxidoreductase [Actinomycetales bacterium]|nr:SDR family oxidoreductase [Actinomycetales bacterium]